MIVFFGTNYPHNHMRFTLDRAQRVIVKNTKCTLRYRQNVGGVGESLM